MQPSVFCRLSEDLVPIPVLQPGLERRPDTERLSDEWNIVVEWVRVVRRIECRGVILGAERGAAVVVLVTLVLVTNVAVHA